jgi:glycosyltransferase involved in cell wall biosynthesis
MDVVVSAHADARALHFTLLGFRLQTQAPARLWVAEDGQDPRLAEVVQGHAALAAFPIQHLTQPHRGFRKWTLVNRAIAASRAPWMVFTDADCVPRQDLLAQYARLARPGRFLAAGSHLELPRAFHEHHLDEGLLHSQRLFDPQLLRQHGVHLPRARLAPPGRWARLLDALTPRSALAGNNSGVWRSDLLRVAGFDETMGYGGADRNLGIRLAHAGVRGQRARHSLVCLHLGHERPWRDPALVAANKRWNRELLRLGEVLPRDSLLLPGAAALPRAPGVAALGGS